MLDAVAKIKVFGVGGGGCNAVRRMVKDKVEGVEFYAVNTDAQCLNLMPVENKVSIGALGAGSKPDVGEKAAIDHEKELRQAVDGADMVYITAGMGGGTGTGASPIIAKYAKEAGALVVAIVTKPFLFEGPRRTKQALAGLEKLNKYCDSIIIVSNEKLLQVFGNVSMTEAFAKADDVLKQGVRIVTELINVPSMINLDFADVKSIMTEAGPALIGIGEAQGNNAGKSAAEKALSSPLLETRLSSASKAVVNISGGPNMTLSDTSDVINYMRDKLGDGLDVIFGVNTKEELGEKVVVTMIITGFGPEREMVEEARKQVTADAAKPEKKDELDDTASFDDLFAQAKKNEPKSPQEVKRYTAEIKKPSETAGRHAAQKDKRPKIFNIFH